jgi:LysM repeat protein
VTTSWLPDTRAQPKRSVAVKGTLKLALAVLSLALIPTLAAAATQAPEVAITSPEEGLTVTTANVRLQAGFAAAGDAGVKALEFLVDDVSVDLRELDPAQASGSVSFLWLARGYADGHHTLCVRAIDSDGVTGEAAITVLLRAPQPAIATGVRIASPSDGQTVSGKATIQVDVDDPGLARYVIFLIDDVFKAMTNVRPFTYAWDTTRYLNGPHTVKAQAFIAGEREAESPAIQVTVSNPSGATAMRSPKLTATPVAPAPMQPPVRTAQPTLPPPMRSESPTPAPPSKAVDVPEVALPGTAPFVSPSGDLIIPTDQKAATPEAAPIEIAALPAFSEGANAPAAFEPLPSAGAPVAAAAEPPVTLSQPSPEPATAPLEVALLPTDAPPSPSAPEPPVASEAALAPAESPAQLEALSQSAPDTAPLEIVLPEQPEQQLSIPPAAATPSEPVTAPAAAPTRQAAAPAAPVASEIQIAMLPPQPVERKPAPRVVAAPTPSPVEYTVRTPSRLDRIAAEIGVPAVEIARANNLSQAAVVPAGRTLVVPSTSLYFDRSPMALDAPAIIADGRAIVPLRSVIEEAGGHVVWDAAEHQASAVARGHAIAVTIGSDLANVDGSRIAMGAPAAIRCDRTVVPLRFLGDALDLVLQYEGGVIHIASGH